MGRFASTVAYQVRYREPSPARCFAEAAARHAWPGAEATGRHRLDRDAWRAPTPFRAVARGLRRAG